MVATVLVPPWSKACWIPFSSKISLARSMSSLRDYMKEFQASNA